MGRIFPIANWGAAPSSLLNGLAAYWKLDEASGSRADSVGGNTLTDNNTVTQATGKVGSAAQFTAANSESLSCADNASLRGGDHDWAWAMWVKLDSLTGTRAFATKRVGAAYEYQVYYSATLVRFAVYCNGGDFRPAGFATPAVGVWYFVYAQYDATANLLGLSVNAASLSTVALASGGSATAGALSLGIDGASYALSGALDEVGFWNRVLTAGERTALYNGGAGVTYPF